VSALVTTALTAGFVALVVVAAGIGVLTWTQIRRERQRLLVEVEVARAVALHKTRLAAYPHAFEAIAPLSTHHRAALTAEVAGNVASGLNTWLYSTGGMCADATTRGAMLGLRDSCDRWATNGGSRPPQLYEFRNLAVTFLRRDLDLVGPEPFEVHRHVSLLAKLRDDLDAFDRRNPLADRGVVPDR
jgi:hypothetical protein